MNHWNQIPECKCYVRKIMVSCEKDRKVGVVIASTATFANVGCERDVVALEVD